MGNIIRFHGKQPCQRVRIVAERFVHFRYTVFPDEDLPFVALQTFCLDDACAAADDLGKTIIQIGPPEAFGGGSAG
jgi:hypothetical protein